jgi:murein DD-endopeptidase MepM/ murein hydrolase activator NlpD
LDRYVTPIAGEEPFIFQFPDVTSPRLQTVIQGELLRLLNEDAGWMQVCVTNGCGWIPSYLVYEVSTQTPPTPEFSLQWPTDYVVITQGFGLNPQNYLKYGLPGHEGVDIMAPDNSHVYACADGVVYMIHDYTTDNHPYGRHIRIDHLNGYKTIYAHLKSIVTLSLNEKVVRGQTIGLADSTGNSTGSHLHLTLKKDGATASHETNFPNDIVDPTPYLVFK